MARWWSVDPLAEPQASFSPYSYTFNNPLKYIDPTGMMGTSATVPDATENGAITWKSYSWIFFSSATNDRYVGWKELR